jgi:hypothetical protein
LLATQRWTLLLPRKRGAPAPADAGCFCRSEAVKNLVTRTSRWTAFLGALASLPAFYYFMLISGRLPARPALFSRRDKTYLSRFYHSFPTSCRQQI